LKKYEKVYNEKVEGNFTLYQIALGHFCPKGLSQGDMFEKLC